MSGNGKKNRYGKLTDLLLSQPLNTRKLKEYARSKKFDSEEIVKLAVTYNALLAQHKLDNMSLFHVACSLSKPDIVEVLVADGWDVNYNCDKVSSPFRTALCSGNIAAARRLIELGADYKSFHGHGCTPMEAALDVNKKEKSCLNAVNFLLKAGVNVNAPVTEEIEERAIHIAVFNNMQSVVSCLLQNGADLNIQDANGSTPLHVAVVKRRFDIMKLLILHGPNIYKENVLGQTPFIMAIHENLKSYMEFFILKGYNLNRVGGKMCNSPLHAAVHYLNKDLIECLINFGANVNLVVTKGLAPLHVVAQKMLLNTAFSEKKCSKARKEIVELLVENGADVNIDTYITSPLVASIKWGGSTGLTKLLLNLGANPNVKYENSMIFFDIVHLNRDLIIHFLEHGASYNSRNESGLTPYHSAILRRVDVKYIKSFVKHGCPYNQDKQIWDNISKMSNYGTEQFFKAEIQYFNALKENNFNDVKQAFESGALISSCSEEMKYPLHFLAFHGNNEMLTCLLEKAFPPNLLNDEGETPLFIAAKHGYYDICRTLLRFGASYNCSSKKCPLTPKAIANACNHKDVVKLFQKVGRIFYLAGLKDKCVITVLKNRFCSNINEYLAFVKATNKRGDSILATALHNNNLKNAKMMMKLQSRCIW